MDSELSAVSIRFFLFADVLADLVQLEPDGGYPRAQRCSPVKFRSLPHSRATAIALFPLRNPITEATGCLGGIAIHICTWSGIKCPSRIWHSFCRARAWKISPNCRRVFPNSTLRRRLGTNTTWYLQSHREWDRL